jgi:CO/xanthine dehydrogenase Mo-binding subunit
VKKKGVGVAVYCHPTGAKGGGDPSQAQARLKLDGTVDLMLGVVDIGQGSSTVMSQIAAEALDIPLENITVALPDTDTGPISMGTGASRVTFMDGNAVIAAAEDLKRQIREWSSKRFEVAPDDLEVKDNKVSVKGNPKVSMTLAEVGNQMNSTGWFPVGKGTYCPPKEDFDPETGHMTSIAAIAYAACVAEVEVDTGTGVIEVKKLCQAYEIGTPLNPLLIKAQIDGGTMQGLGFALSEDLGPNYPSLKLAPKSFLDYLIPITADVPEMQSTVVSLPSRGAGPFGAKGFSEMTSFPPISAVIGAIHDAIGVWICDFPATPERVLRALEAARVSAA